MATDQEHARLGKVEERLDELLAQQHAANIELRQLVTVVRENTQMSRRTLDALTKQVEASEQRTRQLEQWRAAADTRLAQIETRGVQIEARVDLVDKTVQALATKFAYWGGGLVFVSFVVQVAGPTLLRWVFGIGGVS